MKDFNGKVAVITGGASGVGRSLAFALGRRGAKVAIGDVDGKAMEQVGQDLAAGAAQGNATGINSVDDMKKMAARFGIEMQTTHPDEVADMALRGLEQDAFWLLATTPETDAKIQARADMILNRTTPVPAALG